MRFNNIQKFYITLSSYPERQRQAEEEFRKVGIKVESWEGVDKTQSVCHPEVKILPGAYGCSLSHLEIIKYAKLNNLEYVCIFEDDVKLCEDFKERMKYIESLDLEFDMFYLGGHLSGEHALCDETSPTIYDNIFRMYRLAGTYAYIIKNTVYDYLLETIGFERNIDGYYGEIILRRVKTYAFLPFLASCYPNKSLVATIYVDNPHVKWHYSNKLNDMIINTRIGSYGRIGNSLFQVAATLGIADKKKDKANLPVNWELRKQLNIPDEYFGDNIPDIEIKENQFHYDPDLMNRINITKVNDIFGYFQTEKYFEEIKDKIKKWFKPKGIKDLGRWSVGIHIRRGDYIGSQYHINYTPEYYLSAIEKYFNDDRYVFYICTDDVQYAKIHFRGEQFIIEERNPFKDFKILCSCSGHILCNSSFSWWAAYLSNSKKVVRPPKVFWKKYDHFDESDFWIKEWICHEDFKIDLTDVTFIIPTAYDHKDRKENLDLTIPMLLQAFDTNIIIGEQGRHPRFRYTEKYGRYVYFGNMKEFHRTKMLNRMTEFADTPIVVNWDADVIFPPQQILNMVKMLRKDYDFVYPYSGAFLRVGEGARGRNQEYIRSIQESKDIGILKGIEFPGKDDKSVGGAIGYKKHVFIEAGMENENFIAYTPEDLERYRRFTLLGYKIGRVSGPLYHLNHHCGETSLPSNPHFQAGQHELKKVEEMGKGDLLKYIQTWEWGDKRKIVFVTYADENYADRQAKLTARAMISGQMNKVISYNREWLTASKFYLENKSILDEKKGGGYFLWKPYVILQALKDLEENDIVFYLDSEDIFKGDVRSFLLRKLKDIDILLTNGGRPNEEWTKRDCFIKMGCDKKAYWDTIQLEAGILAVKKTAFSIRILKEWLHWCSDYRILGDEKSVMGKELSAFKEHRHDQSILTNLKVKYDLYSSDEMREFVTCNIDLIEQRYLDPQNYLTKLDLKDVTFVMPVKFDHHDREENIEIVVDYLKTHCNANIIIEEQGVPHFQHLEQRATYLHSGLPIFFRTRIINHLIKQVSTPIAFVWDTDVIAPLEQIFDAVVQLRGSYDFAYPYGGGFVHIPREEIADIMDFVNNGETIELSQFNIHSNSVGGAYGFKVESFLKAGMENEHFVRFGWEDVERISRFKKLGYKVYRSLGVLFHLDHFKGKDSNINNPDYIINRYEFNKVDKMTKPQLENYISSWEWLQKT